MEEYLFLLCGAICQVFTGGLHGLQSPSILNWTLLDRGHADRLESTWRSQTKFCIFSSIFINGDISYLLK